MSEQQWRVDDFGVFLCPQCQDDEEREHWPTVEPDEDMRCELCRRYGVEPTVPTVANAPDSART